MPTIQFAGQSAQDANDKQTNTGRLINCYRVPTGGRSPAAIRSVLGSELFVDIRGVNPRACANIDGVLYVVQDGSLWRVNADRTADDLGAVQDNEITTISGNNGKVCVVAGAKYYVWDGTTIVRPADGAFSSYNNVTFFNQLTVLTERGGRRVQWSDVADPLTLDGLKFATTESRDDTNPRGIRMGGALWFFKTRSIEKWYQSGVNLQAIPGSTVDRGLKAFNLICEIPGGCFFISADDKAYLVVGEGMTRVSGPAVESAIATGDPERVFFYRDKGQEICVITYPDRPSWCFNITTQEWHERDEDGEPWTAKDAVFVYGNYCAIHEDGTVRLMSRVGRDLAKPVRRRIQSGTLQMDGKRFRVPLFEAQASVGKYQIDTDGDLSSDVLQVSGSNVLGVTGGALEVNEPEPRVTPQIMLEISQDHGMTWSQPKPRSLGDTGEYRTKLRWRALGQFNNSATVRLSWADPIDVTVEAAAFVEVA